MSHRDMRPWVARCDLFPDSRWSATIHAANPDRALARAQTCADLYAGQLDVERDPITVSTPAGDVAAVESELP